MIPNQVTRAAACKLLAGCALLALAALNAHAQQTTGVPGAPGATTTITGKQIPPPVSEFGGVINEKASDSKPWWPPRIVPPKGAPNVLLIMTDDQGRAKHVRWRHTHPCHGPHCKSRAALHELPFNVAVLAAEPR